MKANLVTVMPQTHPTPMVQIESLFEELVKHYGDGEDRELRVAAKMLMVALDRFREYGGSQWQSLVWEYTNTAVHDQEKFARILRTNRSGNDENTPT